MKIHPYAELFPLMDAAAFDALAADIRDNGLRDPIVTLDGQVLDGRNRLMACRAAGVEPRFVAYDGPDDVLAWVASKNFYRRHLTPSQRALIAAELAERSGASVTRTVAQHGAALGVNERHAQYAATVLREGVPEIVDMVRRGELTVFWADKVTTQPDEQQRRLAEGGPRAIRDWADRVAQPGPRKAFTGLRHRSKHAQAAPPAARRRLYTPFGNEIGSADMAEIESALKALPGLRRLLETLRTERANGEEVDDATLARLIDEAGL